MLKFGERRGRFFKGTCNSYKTQNTVKMKKNVMFGSKKKFWFKRAILKRQSLKKMKPISKYL